MFTTATSNYIIEKILANSIGKKIKYINSIMERENSVIHRWHDCTPRNQIIKIKKRIYQSHWLQTHMVYVITLRIKKLLESKIKINTYDINSLKISNT